MSTDCDRPVLHVTRTHQRFLLRQLHFTQQFAAMYFHRLHALKPRAESRYDSLRNTLTEDIKHRRVLEIAPGETALCIGTLFKHVKAYPRFLDEYQKELVRIELGEDDGEGGDGMDEAGDDIGGGDAGDGGVVIDDADTAPLVGTVSDEGTNFCSDADVLLLEDDSGRVELCGVDAHQFVTGVVVLVVGTLLDKGKFDVTRLELCGASPQSIIPRPAVTVQPVYIAFVSGMNCSYQGVAAAQTDMLVDFLGGNLGDDDMVHLASRVARLVIGGNSIDACDELKLKHKVKLDFTDHVKVNDVKEPNSAANCMRALDRLLSALADTVDVDLMPGDTDPSNSFLPQQPLHPILLREASKRTALRLVTNPFEFTAFHEAAPNKPSFFVTSGANIDDMMRQCRLASPLDALAMTIECGCACPTAPNSLLCYPFQDSDPFLFPQSPHVAVACNQREFATRYQTIGGDDAVSTRLVTVPAFSKSGVIVLVDVSSPTFATTSVQLI